MRDYAQQINDLRSKAESFDYDGWVETAICLEHAADAIEELVAMACPHYHRNVHDRGDDSYCDVLNTEPPKEKA